MKTKMMMCVAGAGAVLLLTGCSGNAEAPAAEATPSEAAFVERVLTLEDLKPGMYEGTVDALAAEDSGKSETYWCWVTVTDPDGDVMMEKSMYENIWFRAFKGATITLDGNCPTEDQIERTAA
jgi:ABC-type glycerol-3-phosphate transport system substrate-binding protein